MLRWAGHHELQGRWRADVGSALSHSPHGLGAMSWRDDRVSDTPDVQSQAIVADESTVEHSIGA